MFILNCPRLHLVNHFIEDCLSIHIQLVSALCLFLIQLRQFLTEDFFCQPRLYLRDTLFGQESFGWIYTVADHVDMGMMPFIVKSGIPSEIRPRNLHCLGHLHGILGKQRFPFIRLVITEPGGILPAQ